MVLRETGAKLLTIILIGMHIKNGWPCVNAKPYRPNICTVQLRGQIFSRPRTRAALRGRSLRCKPNSSCLTF